MKAVMIKIHEVWLETLMGAFMSQTDNKQRLYDFANILFRHFTWIENELIKSGESYSYDRDNIPIKVESLAVLLKDIDMRLNDIDLQLISLQNKDLANRISGDIRFIQHKIEHMPDEIITAFDMKRVLDGYSLSSEATDALTLFLFEESYKEYELIMIYNYLKAHSNDAFMNRIFQILIDESMFHLKCFGDMMAKMGILAVPRVVMRELYQVTDVVKFLENGIDEEIQAKEECKRLAEAVAKDNASLAEFFDFINNQENYHIALMRDALNHYKKVNEIE
jgi:rubrerythrin